MSRVRAWTCWLVTAIGCGGIACGGIAQEDSSRGNDDPFSTFGEQPSGRRGGGRRGTGNGPPPFSTPAPLQPTPDRPPPATSLQPERARPLREQPLPPAIPADAGSPSCDAGSCAPLGCEAGALRCNGAVLEQCATSGQLWEPQQTCASSCLCDIGLAQGSCAAPSCVSGEVRCSGNQLQACNDCRTGYLLVAVCAAAEACHAETNSCDVDGSDGPIVSPEEGNDPGVGSPDAGVPTP